MRSMGEVRGGTTPFLTSAKQLESLISEINRTSRCRAPGCDGIIHAERTKISTSLLSCPFSLKLVYVCTFTCLL